MLITNEIKEQIAQALQIHFDNNKTTYGSLAKYSNFIGVNKSTVSNVLNRKWLENPQLVSDKKWLEIANAINFNIAGFMGTGIQVAQTQVYKAITRWLDYLKKESSVSMLCDDAGVGKSFTCEQYRDAHHHVYYIVGSDCDRKNAFIKELARVTGAGTDGRYADMLERAIDVLKSSAAYQPLLIIDEAGDLDDGTMRILKKLYNKLEDRCGIALLGSTDLKKKIKKSIERNKNAYEEVYSRFKRRYVEIVPNAPHQRSKFMQQEMLMVLQANGVQDKELQQQIIKRAYDLRSIKEEIKKLRRKTQR